MIGKAGRLELIREIVEGGLVRNQSELLARLAENELVVDQSTVSRDLVELGIRKVDGRYAVVDARDRPEPRRDLSELVRDWSPCGPHMIVLRTTVGQAQSIGVAIDAAREPSIAGVLAGDDTLFIATRSKQQQGIALRRLERWFGAGHA